MQQGEGILPDWEISGLVSAGVVQAPPLLPRQVQPASLDLRLGHEAFRLRASFLPAPGRTVEQEVREFGLHRIDLGQGGVLEPGSVYLVPICERLALPPDVRARANPKSSTGRLDIFARLIADGGTGFDDVPAGYEGVLWVELSPRTFPVVVRPGSRLVQLRFVRGGASVLTPGEHRELHARDPLVGGGGQVRVGDGVELSVDLDWGPTVAGWRARRHAGVVDVDVVGALDPLDFWEPVRPARGGGIVLDPDEFYILASTETVRVPYGYAAEMTAFDAGVGEFRAHYAGFFDPGFGYGDGVSSRGVLEVRPRDVPFLLRQGQPICRLVYERMAGEPRVPYGAQSNYQNQGLRLSKAFRPFDA